MYVVLRCGLKRENNNNNNKDNKWSKKLLERPYHTGDFSLGTFKCNTREDSVAGQSERWMTGQQVGKS